MARAPAPASARMKSLPRSAMAGWGRSSRRGRGSWTRRPTMHRRAPTRRAIVNRSTVVSSVIVVGAIATGMAAQQPTVDFGEGPTVCIDEAHFNMHTASGTYSAVAGIWRANGYVVEPSTRAFTTSSLLACGVLVIANALHERNRDRGDDTDWSLPTPSAFTPREITAVRDWVHGGGALLLIADHTDARIVLANADGRRALSDSCCDRPPRVRHPFGGRRHCCRKGLCSGTRPDLRRGA